MENYRKGKNVEEPLDRDKIPIPNLPKNFLWMQVRGGSKIRNLLTHALNEFPSAKYVVWTGFGQSVGKAVSCAELMKSELGNKLHQITKLGYRLCEEYWDPLLPGLDQLIVKRKLPMIFILLSSEILDTNEHGYQPPGTFIPYIEKDTSKKNRKQNNNYKNNKRKNPRKDNQNKQPVVNKSNGEPT